MKQIPNLFTLLNLICGCIAIVFILQNGLIVISNENNQQLIDVAEKTWMASLFIGLAGVVDFLDGFIARMFKASSEMGKQLDSLADVVSFGVAPSMILYQFLRISFAQDPNGLDVSIIWPSVAFIFAAAAAYRLAKFNLDTTQKFSFKGLPTPAAGLLIASFPLIYYGSGQQWVVDLLRNKWFLYATIVIVSFLMVSRIPLMSLKFKDFTLGNNIPKIIIAVIAIVSLFLFKAMAIPVIFLAYVLVSLLFKNKIA